MLMDSGHNPYGFIFDQNQSPKSGLGSTLKGNKLFLIAAGLLGLLLIVLILSLAFGGEGGQREKFIDIAARQQEIIRISHSASSKATSLETRNFAITTKLSVTTAQKNLLAALGKSVKIKPAELNSYKSTEVDSRLATALQNNQYDQAYRQIIDNYLSEYQKRLSETFKASGSTRQKSALDFSYRQVSVLLNKN